MINILKQFEEWDTSLKQSKFKRATLRLTIYYVISTFCILLLSSVVILVLFSPPDSESVMVANTIVETEHDEFSLYEFREHLLDVLIVVDVIVLFFVTILAYFFARRTLRPIEQIYKLQEQFVGDVAHELRTPLAVMKSGGEAILRKERSVSEYQEFIRESNEEVDRLSRLSNQLLSLLSQKAIIRPREVNVNLAILIKNQVKRYQEYADSKNVTIKLGSVENIEFNANEDDIIQLVQNLIKNAVDYNKVGGEVIVELVKIEGKIVFSVKDTGVGIPTESQPYIFDRFYKVDSARKCESQTGTGLGLAIVKDIVDKYNGQIEVESEVGIGTTIKVFLPVI